MSPDLTFPVKKLVNLTDEQARQITEFRYDQRLPSDNEAIRRLIELGLEAAKGSKGAVMAHRFEVGDHVKLPGGADGAYSVEELLPPSDPAGFPNYRIKRLKDGHVQDAAEAHLAQA